MGGRRGTPGNQGGRQKNANVMSSPNKLATLREFFEQQGDRGSRWAAVLFLLGSIMQLLPWAAGLLGITVNYTLGWIVVVVSVLMFFAALVITWRLNKFAAALLAIGAVGLSWFAWGQVQKIPKAKEIEARIDKLSLHDYYRTDFDRYEQRASGAMTITDSEPKFPVEYSLVYDLHAQSKFVVYYIQKTEMIYAVCDYLSQHTADVLKNAPQFKVVEKGTGDSGTISTEATKFSGRIFVYHETFMDAPQTVSLTKLYESRGASVIFRSIDYLSNQKTEMKVRELRNLR